ncbi:MAG: hypothetical protein ACSHYA_09790 [Opitutaceae bacterium]
MNSKPIYLLVSFVSLSAAVSANTAVSDVNGKVAGSYGNLDSTEARSLAGSFSVPLFESLGFQFDGLHTVAEDVEFTGFGAHLFWRESDKGLIGLAGGAVFGDLVDSYELSAEAEYYFDMITVGARAGWASIEYDNLVAFIDTEKDGAFAQVYATAYPLDDLAVTLTGETRFENSYVSLDVEYELPVSGLSLFVSAMAGDHDYDHALFGIRYYFGGDKSLKLRHREDDPQNMVRGIMSGVGTYGAEYNERGRNYFEDNYDGGYYGNYGSSFSFVGDYGASSIVSAPVGGDVF